jgi:hypothetical protein
MHFTNYILLIITDIVHACPDQPRVSEQGRQNEHTMDALALRAEEGRGTAPICPGEPLAGCDPGVSE